MGYTYGPHDIISQVPQVLPEDVVALLTPYPEDPATHVRDSPNPAQNLHTRVKRAPTHTKSLNGDVLSASAPGAVSCQSH
ncbi:hypothetical protein BV22DRAFT_1041725 [Leucogyrophana mollusca]|uniref:Uncharacterized protein n=1 Tax=Leucogyrophana mollusca TaxID=85980 RepID=A0ACB8B1D2_9AGAM|nr:hypothetical protein BV22DRAFT_1041725 [Leucogyrophana mollusca]